LHFRSLTRRSPIASGNAGLIDEIPLGFSEPLPRSSTPNCHWPPGWDLAGERARPGCRFRRRAKNRFPNYPQRRQVRHICRTKTKMKFSPVGAAYSARTPDDVAPDGALALGG